MGSGSVAAPAAAARLADGSTETDPAGRPLKPLTILLLALWLGLIAGFLDLGFLIIQTKLIQPDFFRLGDAFPWIIPTAVAVLVTAPCIVLALIATVRARAVPRWLALAVPAFLASLNLSAKLPLDLWASILLTIGLAVQFTRMAGRHFDGVVQLARRTLPFLAGAVVVLALATSGVRGWTEHRAIAALPAPPKGARNVILIVWDTVRARNLSLHGYFRPTTPNLERLAARGAHFKQAFSTSPWTLPSHASFFTGRWPYELSAGWRTPLDTTYPTLAEHVRSLGFDTAGFVANLDYCSPETGIARGFTHYEDYPLNAWEVFSRYIGLGRRVDKPSIAMAASLIAGRRHDNAPLIPVSKEHAKRAEDIDRAFLDWLTWQQPRGRPFFAYLNYNDAHTPYEPPPGTTQGFGLRPTTWDERIALLEWNNIDKLKLPPRTVQLGYDLYDDSIAHLDRRLGLLVDELERRGTLDDTLLIVLSDHGEHLGDHALFFHGCSLYRQLVQVPLVIVDPKHVPAGHVVDEPISLRDIPATVLDLLRIEGQGSFPGRSLTRFWNREPDDPAPTFEPLQMETEKPMLLTNQGREPAAKGPMKGLVAEGMHYIQSGDGHEELFHLKGDPEERFNAAESSPAVIANFRALLDAQRKPPPP